MREADLPTLPEQRAPAGKQVVLGAGGAIARATQDALVARGLDVLAIGHAQADARNPAALLPYLTGATHVYLCIGLPYSAAVWERDWPAILRAVLSGCKAVGARLVFFDNIYLYGPPPLGQPITEDHLQQPTTRKGRVRKEIVDQALAAHRQGRVPAVIGRSADFYGPGAVNSPFYIRFLEHLLAGKPPQTLMPNGPVHTWAYTRDCGRALVELGLDPQAYGEAWHLPVGDPVTVEDMGDYFRQTLKRDFAISYVSPRMTRLLARVSRTIREVSEMGFQFEQDYVLDWQRFSRRYPDFRVTPYDVGVDAMVDYFLAQQQQVNRVTS
ncbi:NAD-dependent epimerase/dehydratase [gamma proteobacterium NOR5-3]|nr:NAD-dependent epimerase/dehydratase [gamma proteobacterium NOR5-3]